jgi:hypothetical protein
MPVGGAPTAQPVRAVACPRVLGTQAAGGRDVGRLWHGVFMSDHPPHGPRSAETPQEVVARVAEAKRRRVELTAGSRDLVEKVAGLLFADDPMGIAFGSNSDEYTAEAEVIVIGLPGAADVGDVVALAHQTFVQWFSAEDAGRASGTRGSLATSGRRGWSIWAARPDVEVTVADSCERLVRRGTRPAGGGWGRSSLPDVPSQPVWGFVPQLWHYFAQVSDFGRWSQWANSCWPNAA